MSGTMLDSCTRTRAVGIDPGQRIKMMGTKNDDKIFENTKKKIAKRLLVNMHNVFGKCFGKENTEYRNAIESMTSLNEDTQKDSVLTSLVGHTYIFI